MIRCLFIFGLIILQSSTCNEDLCDDLDPTHVQLMFFDKNNRIITSELTELIGLGSNKYIPIPEKDSIIEVELKLKSGTTSFIFEYDSNSDTINIDATVTGIYEGRECGYNQTSTLDKLSASSGVDSVYYEKSDNHYSVDVVKIFLK